MIRSRARLDHLVVASLDADESIFGTATEETDIDFLYSDLINRDDDVRI